MTIETEAELQATVQDLTPAALRAIARIEKLTLGKVVLDERGPWLRVEWGRARSYFGRAPISEFLGGPAGAWSIGNRPFPRWRATMPYPGPFALSTWFVVVREHKTRGGLYVTRLLSRLLWYREILGDQVIPRLSDSPARLRLAARVAKCLKGHLSRSATSSLYVCCHQGDYRVSDHPASRRFHPSDQIRLEHSCRGVYFTRCIKLQTDLLATIDSHFLESVLRRVFVAKGAHAGHLLGESEAGRRLCVTCAQEV
jgi:hypothetical protein